nr:hemerythrin domain-containing protein [Anaerolineae bacterium]
MISQFMSDDHRRCDVQFTQAENAADQGDMSTAKAAFNEFVTAMERHFAMEEQELFPAFE